MPRRRNPSIVHAFDLARLGAEAWMVVGLRLAKLAAGGPAAALEAQRMVAEKSAAAMEAQFAAGLALASGASHITPPAAKRSRDIAAASKPTGDD